MHGCRFWHDEVMRSHPTTTDRVLLGAGAGIVLVGLVIIVIARLSVTRSVYVSELGATGEPTAGWFSVALASVALGGAVIAQGSRSIRSRVRWLARWTPAVSLLVASASFAVASQVTCTAGCPLPVGDAFTWQDLIHTTIAVVGFAAACFAMLQVAFADGARTVARMSLVAGVLVAVIAGLGGLLSLLRVATDVGGWLELTATCVAVLWLAVYGIILASPSTSPTRGPASPAAELSGRRLEPEPARTLLPEEG